MKIASLQLRGMRGAPDCDLDFVDGATGQPHRLVVVTGPPASGKTRLLEAILAAKEIIAPYGIPPRAADWLGASGARATARIGWRFDAEEVRTGGLASASSETESRFTVAGDSRLEDPRVVAVLRRYEHSHETGKLEYFPAERAIPASGAPHGAGAFQQRMVRATKDPRKYGVVQRVVRDLAAGSGDAATFASLLAVLSTTCRFSMPAESEGAAPRCFESEGGSARALGQLARSEADAVLIAATASLLRLDRSIVLLDRPELHVPPSGVASFVQGLLLLGTNVQIIVATSSQALVAATPAAQLVRLEAPPSFWVREEGAA